MVLFLVPIISLFLVLFIWVHKSFLLLICTVRWFIPVNVVLGTISGSLIGLLVATIVRPPYPYFKFTIIQIGVGSYPITHLLHVSSALSLWIVVSVCLFVCFQVISAMFLLCYSRLYVGTPPTPLVTLKNVALMALLTSLLVNGYASQLYPLCSLTPFTV